MSSIYDCIGVYLTKLDGDEVRLSFEKLDEITGGLALSSKYDRTWWANTLHPSRTQAKGWMNAGWKVDKVDFGFGVKFIRIK